MLVQLPPSVMDSMPPDGAGRGCQSAASGEQDDPANHVNVKKSNQVNFDAFRGSFLESTLRSVRTRPPDVVVGRFWTATRGVTGWRGRIRTFDLLIQSQAPYRLATRQWSGRDDTASPRQGRTTGLATILARDAADVKQS